MKVFFLLTMCLLTVSVKAQKHTFTNNIGLYKNINTGETIESENVDDITIEILDNGLYKLVDSKESMTLRYSHSENYKEGTMYIYKILGKQHAIIKSGKKMSDMAKGIPGKFAIDADGLSIVAIYKLNN